MSFPEKGMGALPAYEKILETIANDIDPQKNAGTYTQTWIDEPTREIMDLFADKNLINREAYPGIMELERQCIERIADLWHAPYLDKVVGMSTVGSSEACMLAGLILLERWREHMMESVPMRNPNIIVVAANHVCWDKFFTMHRIQKRVVPISLEHPTIDPEKVRSKLDENSIGIISTYSNTLNGRYDDIAAVNAMLREYNEHAHFPVRIHVDAAGGGLFEPFMENPRVWDFALENVLSISVSGSKAGLAPPTVAWILWRDKGVLPMRYRPEKFEVAYIGHVKEMGLNFSRPSGQIAAQAYLFDSLGHDGYTRIHRQTRDHAFRLYRHLQCIPGIVPLFEPTDYPVVCWSAARGFRQLRLDAVAQELKRRTGWMVPAYDLPSNLEHIKLSRFVCRRGLTDDAIDAFVEDYGAVVADFMSGTSIA